MHLSCESLALCIIPQTLARIGIAKPFTASRAMRRNLGWSGSRKARKSRVVLSGLCVSVCSDQCRLVVSSSLGPGSTTAATTTWPPSHALFRSRLRTSEDKQKTGESERAARPPNVVKAVRPEDVGTRHRWTIQTSICTVAADAYVAAQHGLFVVKVEVHSCSPLLSEASRVDAARHPSFHG